LRLADDEDPGGVEDVADHAPHERVVVDHEHA
jgi:hypothetical protein